MTLKSGLTVKTTKKNIPMPAVEDIFIRNRRNTADSTIDSAVYHNFNKFWLVKHSSSKLVRGISIGYYGVYHEDELEVVELPPVIEEEEEEYYLNY